MDVESTRVYYHTLDGKDRFALIKGAGNEHEVWDWLEAHNISVVGSGVDETGFYVDFIHESDAIQFKLTI